MCRPPSSGRVRRRACGLPYPASGRRSRPSVALQSARLLFDRCAGDPAAARRSPILPASSGVRRGGEVVIPRPVFRGPMAVVLPRSRSPIPPSRFGRATADYVDRPQAALGPVIGRERRRVRPVIAPPPFAPPPANQLRSRR